MAKKYFSTPEAAKMLGISRIAVFKQIQSGTLPALRVGKNYIIEKTDLLNACKLRLAKDNRKQKQALKRVMGS